MPRFSTSLAISQEDIANATGLVKNSLDTCVAQARADMEAALDKTVLKGPIKPKRRG